MATPRQSAVFGEWPQWTTPLIAGSLAVGGVLRFVAQSPLWLDEALTVNIARLPVIDIFDALGRDGHPPLYYVVLHFWMRVFGESDASVRALAAIFGLAAIAVGQHLARRLSGPTAAAATAVVMATSPFAVRYATEGRMYSLLMLLGLGLWLSVERALEDPRRARLAAVSVVSGALLLTHYWAFPAVGAAILVLAAKAWRWSPTARRSEVRVAVAVAAGGVTFLPWLPVFFEQLRGTGTPWATPPRLPTIPVTTLSEFAGGADHAEGVALLMVVVVLAVVGVVGRTGANGLVELGERIAPDARSAVIGFGVTMAVGIAMVVIANSAFESRYTAVVYGLFAVLVGLGLSRLSGRIMGGIALLLVAAIGLVGSLRVVVEDRTQGGQIATSLAVAESGDAVVFCPDQLGPAVARSMPGEVVGLGYPSLDDPNFVDWTDYQERQSGADPDAIGSDLVSRFDGQSIWLVTRGGYRTFDTQCERLTAALAAARGAPAHVVRSDASIFEPADLLVFAP